jgi:hypothetical protein
VGPFLRLADQVDDHAMVCAPPSRSYRHLHDGHDEPGADQQRERENQNVGDPERPAQHLDLAGDRRGRPTVWTGDEQPARNRDARAERGQDRGQRDGLPQHDRSPRGPHRPCRTGQQGRNRSDQQQRYEGEGQG